MRTTTFFSLVTGLCLTSAAVGAAPVISLDGLAANSPFAPQNTVEAAAQPTEEMNLEFRGLISTHEGILFGLYDRSRNLGAWVKENEKGAEFNVQSYDAARESLTVNYQGRMFTLLLSSAKIGLASPTALPLPTTPSSFPQATATKGDDQRRLESVAAEVRRRRALRQAAPAVVQPPVPKVETRD